MQAQTKFETAFHLYDSHFGALDDYLGAILPILMGKPQVLPMFVESTVVLIQAWHEDFLKSIVSTAAREKEADTREYFRKHGRKDALSCDLPRLLKMARGRIKFDDRGEAIADIFARLLGFAPWPDEEVRNMFVDFNFLRQFIVHHSDGVLGDDYFLQFTDKTLLSVKQYEGLPAIRRVAHGRVLIFIKEFLDTAVKIQNLHIRTEMLSRPEWIYQPIPKVQGDAETK